jgi:hypothetical protein
MVAWGEKEAEAAEGRLLEGGSGRGLRKAGPEALALFFLPLSSHTPFQQKKSIPLSRPSLLSEN